jgi:hypothetical protein
MRDLDHLQNLLRARTDNEGNPKKGYKSNVAMLRREIAQLEAAMAVKDTVAEQAK